MPRRRRSDSADGRIWRMNGLANLRVFISGSCGDIGRAVAARFLAADARVVLGDLLGRKAGQKLAQSLHPTRAIYLPCDVTSTPSVVTAFAAVERQWKGIDVVICCAGRVANEPFLQITEDQWARTPDVNLTGSLRVAQAGARLMMKNPLTEDHRPGRMKPILLNRATKPAPAPGPRREGIAQMELPAREERFSERENP